MQTDLFLMSEPCSVSCSHVDWLGYFFTSLLIVATTCCCLRRHLTYIPVEIRPANVFATAPCYLIHFMCRKKWPEWVMSWVAWDSKMCRMLNYHPPPKASSQPTCHLRTENLAKLRHLVLFILKCRLMINQCFPMVAIVTNTPSATVAFVKETSWVEALRSQETEDVISRFMLLDGSGTIKDGNSPTFEMSSPNLFSQESVYIRSSLHCEICKTNILLIQCCPICRLEYRCMCDLSSALQGHQLPPERKFSLQ